MGTKVAIVSDKPQTTRAQDPGHQDHRARPGRFFRLPGHPQAPFQAERADDEGGATTPCTTPTSILYFIDIGAAQQDEFIFRLLQRAGKKVFLVINKIDKLNKGRVLEKIQEYKDAFPWKEIVPISALKGDNLDLIEDLIFQYLPEGENFFPPRRPRCSRRTSTSAN